MDVKWKIRKFQDTDRPAFLDWRKFVAHRDKSPEFVEWEYYSSPFGPVETWVADDNGQIVGQYSLQRYDCHYFGKIVRASLAFDAGTHPDYRYQGMFTRLGNHSLRKEGESNVAFSLGFPWVGGIALPGHMKVGWTKIGQLSIYARTSFDDFNGRDTDDITIKRITLFDERFDELAKSENSDLPIMLVRNQSYLNWRFIHKIGYTYYPFEIQDKGKLVGYFVLKIYESEQSRILHIVDFILPSSEAVYSRVLGFVFEKAQEFKVDKVNLAINENHHFFTFLEMNDFTKEERHFVPIVHRNIEDIDEERLMDFKNHYFTMGDIDLF